jgi:hypothetical protein
MSAADKAPAGDHSGRQRHELVHAPGLIRRRSFPKRVRCFIVPAAATDKHQGHQSASDDDRKERAKTKRDPAMFSYLDAGGLIQDQYHPYACGYQYARQCNENNDSTFAHTFHRRAFP